MHNATRLEIAKIHGVVHVLHRVHVAPCHVQVGERAEARPEFRQVFRFHQVQHVPKVRRVSCIFRLHARRLVPSYGPTHWPCRKATFKNCSPIALVVIATARTPRFTSSRRSSTPSAPPSPPIREPSFSISAWVSLMAWRMAA